MGNGRYLLIIFLNIISVFAYREFDRNGVITILAFDNDSVELRCQTDAPMAYCGFVHESGKRYSFSGTSPGDGRCTVKIKATKRDSGQWNCHIGGASPGVETRQTIHLRVVSQVAAIQPNVTAMHGKPVTLECATVRRLSTMKYCRFEPPSGSPFSISSAITKDNPIVGRYYFPQNRSIDRGDCAVTIHKVKYEDVGVWTCGAGLDDGKEYIDTINLEVEGLYAMSTASATGITFGVIGAAIFLFILGIVVWKKKRFLGSAQHEEPEVIEAQEIRTEPIPPQPSPSPRAYRQMPRVTVQSPSEPSISSATLK